MSYILSDGELLNEITGIERYCYFNGLRFSRLFEGILAVKYEQSIRKHL